MNSKRGQSIGLIDMFHYLPRLGILVVLIFFTITIVNISVQNEVAVFEAEADMVIGRLLYSRNGISYYDGEIGRLYPGMINVSLFNAVHVNKTTFGLGDDDKHLAMHIELHEGKDVKQFYVNKKWYKRWSVFTNLEAADKKELMTIRGKGGKDAKLEKFVVTIMKEDGTRSVGKLVVKLVMPRV